MEIRKRVQGRVYSSGKVWTKDLFEYRNLVEHEFMNIGLKWTICMWGLRNNEQIVRGKSQVGFRRAIYKSWKAENSRIRLPEIPSRRGAEGGAEGEYLARGQTSKHTLSTHTRIRFEARTNTNGKDSYGATNDWNDLHSMSNRTSPLLFLAPFVSPSPPSPIRKTLCGPLWTGYLLRGRCRLNLINSMRHLDKCAPRTRASKE